MRILFLTPFLPDPAASHGGGSYLGALAEGMSKGAKLGLVHLSHPNERSTAADLWTWRRSASYLGRPTGLAHRLRMLSRWRSRPLLAAKYWQPELCTLLREAQQEFRPDVVLVEMAQMAQYLPLVDGVPTVLTDHEAGKPANANTGLGAWADRRDAKLWRDYVRNHYPRATRLQAVTAEDAAELLRLTGSATEVRPPTLAIPTQPSRPGEAPPRALFLGDYRHGPNPEAATRLAREVWPIVRQQCPDAELLLAGPHEAAISMLGDLPGVRVAGFVEDLGELFGSARLVLAPLWSGAGFRVKNATALAHGVPVVTNELGSRGCRAPEPACTVVESSQELADATVRLLEESNLAASAGKAARSWAEQTYDARAVADRQLASVRELLA